MLGPELQRARRKAGLTQEELAFRAGVDRSYVSLLEHDKKSPTLDMLLRLCAALGVRASSLVARVERGQGHSSKGLSDRF
jgi:transcriptional regulator with XRE-family HTH domain